MNTTCSRGASVLTALIPLALVGILAAGASVLISTSVDSQSATAATPTAPAKTQVQTQACMPGQDIQVTTDLDTKKTVIKTIDVCAELGTAARKSEYQDVPNAKGFGVQDARCDKNSNGLFIPKVGLKWVCRKMWCAIPPTTGTGIYPNDATSQKSFPQAGDTSGIRCHSLSENAMPITAAGAFGEAMRQVLPGNVDATTQQGILDALGLTKTDMGAVNYRLFQEGASPTVDPQLTTAINTRVSAEQTLDALYACTDPNITTPPGVDCGQFKDNAALTAAQKQALIDLEKAKKAEADLAAQMAKASADQTGLIPPAQSVDTTTGYSQSTYYSQGSYGPQSPSGPGQNTFQESTEQNNVRSPLSGGACTTGYMCSNNTLYYQSQSQDSTHFYCTAQPVQQCPYGCYGAASSQQSGIAGTLGIIASGMKVISSLFGGNSGVSQNQNALTSGSGRCATQQEQYAGQYGVGTNGQACAPSPVQPDPSSCTTGTWRPLSAQKNGCVTGFQCVPNAASATSNTNPTAQISCEPRSVDSGMQINISYACINATGSSATGFSTNNQLIGTTTAVATTPQTGSVSTYALTCTNGSLTSSATCDVQVGKPAIVLVANPSRVAAGATSLIGWITSGMQSCVISSPTFPDFTAANANNTNVNGSVLTPSISQSATFKLSCATFSGDTRESTTVVTN